MNRNTYTELTSSRGPNTTALAVATLIGCAGAFVGKLMGELAELRWGLYEPLGGSDRFSLPFFTSVILTVACLGFAVCWAALTGSSFRFALTGRAIGLAFLAAVFRVIPLCMENVRILDVPTISRVLLQAITPIAAVFFARLMVGNDARRWCHGASVAAVILVSAALIAQDVDPGLTHASSFSALNVGWSFYYFFAVVLGEATYFAATAAFMARVACAGENERESMGPSTDLLGTAGLDSTRYRVPSAIIMFVLMTSFFSAGLHALGPLYDALPRVGVPTTDWYGAATEDSIGVRESYRYFVSGFTQCIFTERGQFRCQEWQTFVGVGVVCSIAITIGVALGTLLGPLCPMIALFAASVTQSIVVSAVPSWSPLIPLHLSGVEYGEAAAALSLLVVAFLLWLVWEFNSRREAAQRQVDTTAYFYPERASYQPGFQSGPLTYQPVNLTDGFGVSKAAV